MSGNGQPVESPADGHVLRWPGRVLTQEDLRGRLNGHRELVLLPRAIITPLAQEQLKTNGVRIVREAAAKSPAPAARPWGYAPEGRQPMVRTAVQSLEREGVSLRELCPVGDDEPCRWARAVAECVANGECAGGVLFCHDPGLVSCVANKVAGLRAVSVNSVAQAARATLTLGANLVAVEMPGRTFFEVRQILRVVCLGVGACPPGVACTLRELDGHAHR